MTEQQFQIFCKVIYRVTVMTLMLQIVACGMMIWMFWRGMPEYQDVLMGLAGSIIWSLMLLSSKKRSLNVKKLKWALWAIQALCIHWVRISFGGVATTFLNCFLCYLQSGFM